MTAFVEIVGRQSGARTRGFQSLGNAAKVYARENGYIAPVRQKSATAEGGGTKSYGMVIQVVQRLRREWVPSDDIAETEMRCLPDSKSSGGPALRDALLRADGIGWQRDGKQHDWICGACGNVVGDELHHAMLGDCGGARRSFREVVIERYGDSVDAVRRRRRTSNLAADGLRSS